MKQNDLKINNEESKNDIAKLKGINVKEMDIEMKNLKLKSFIKVIEKDIKNSRGRELQTSNTNKKDQNVIKETKRCDLKKKEVMSGRNRVLVTEKIERNVNINKSGKLIVNVDEKKTSDEKESNQSAKKKESKVDKLKKDYVNEERELNIKNNQKEESIKSINNQETNLISEENIQNKESDNFTLKEIKVSEHKTIYIQNEDLSDAESLNSKIEEAPSLTVLLIPSYLARTIKTTYSFEVATPTWYNNLPIKVLHNIFQYFNERYLLKNIVPVCQHWKFAATRPILWKNFRVRGQHVPTMYICDRIRCFTHLKSIFLENIADPIQVIRQICRCCPKLKKLAIRHCTRVPEGALRYVLQSCVELESLDLSGTEFRGNSFYQDVCSLINLK